MIKSWKKLTLALLVGALVASISGGSPVWAQEETETVTETVAAAVVEEAAPAAEEEDEAPPYETVEAFLKAPILYPKFMIDNLWVLIAAFLVFTMHLGFATLESGLTQSKNTVNVLFKNLFVVSIGILTYAFCGFNLMYPGDYPGDFNGWLGFAGFGIPNVIPEDPEALFGLTTPVGYELDMTVWTDFIFQAMFAATAATIVSGAVAERIKLSSFMLFATLLVAISYPITGSWKWGGGWLDQMDFYDFAGSTIVHGVGGAAALACVILLGARRGKYLPDGKVRPILGHSMPLATIGVFLLWLGWFGFNGGSVLLADPNLVSFVFVTTAIAAASGAVASMFTAWILLKKPDLSMALNGVLAGLVGITAGADSVSVMSAVIIGIIAGILVVISILFLDKIKIDDPVGAISVHGTCGVWGTLAVGIFGIGDFSFMTQLIGTVSILLFTFVFSLVVFGLIKVVLGVRVSEEEEVEGLDIGEHGQEAYPDFQPVSRS